MRSRADEEQEALLERVIKNSRISGAALREQILRYLFAQRKEKTGVKAVSLAAEGLGWKGLASDDRVRTHIVSLRDDLDKYAKSNAGQLEKWCITLPTSPHGYRLSIVDKTRIEGAVGAFWQAHFDSSDDVVVVCNEPLFFRDDTQQMVIRYLDVNLDANEKKQIRELEALHPKRPPGAWRVAQVYLMSGEIEGRDAIVDWFSLQGVSIKKSISRDLTPNDLKAASPILFGSLRISTPIQSVFSARQDLRYRLSEEAGCIQIIRPISNEKLAMETNCPQNFLETKEGNLLVRDDPPPGRVFGIVTRIANPWRDKAVTIIASEWSKATAEIAHFLTDRDRMDSLFKRLGPPSEEPFPRCCEMLFSVNLYRDSSAHPPEFICSSSEAT